MKTKKRHKAASKPSSKHTFGVLFLTKCHAAKAPNRNSHNLVGNIKKLVFGEIVMRAIEPNKESKITRPSSSFLFFKKGRIKGARR